MKKTITIVAIVLGFSLGGFAQGGLFQRGVSDEQWGGRDVAPIMMPNGHGYTEDVNPQTGDPTTPLGSGVVILLGFGAAYLAAKKHEED